MVNQQGPVIFFGLFMGMVIGVSGAFWAVNQELEATVSNPIPIINWLIPEFSIGADFGMLLAWLILALVLFMLFMIFVVFLLMLLLRAPGVGTLAIFTVFFILGVGAAFLFLYSLYAVGVLGVT